MDTQYDIWLARLTAALKLEDKTYAKHDAAVEARNATEPNTAERAVAQDEVEYRWSMAMAATAHVAAVQRTCPIDNAIQPPAATGNTKGN